MQPHPLDMATSCHILQSTGFQRFQIFLHKHLLERIFDSPELIRPLLFMRMAHWFPQLQLLTARAIAVGIRPEHVR